MPAKRARSVQTPAPASGLTEPVSGDPGPLVLEAGSARLVVSPADGGRVASLRLDGRELIARVDEGPIWWGSYPMAPFAGRIRRGEFTFRGRRYRLPLNMAPHAIHGVVFDRPWEVTGPDSIEVRLGEPWPFAGTVAQRFELEPDRLRVSLELAADEPMPAWMGWHPWFRRRLDDGPEVELAFEPGSMFERDAEGIPSGRLVRPTAGPWDDCFRELASDPRLSWPGGPELTISSSCDDWVVFNQRDDALCVEPQSAPPDAVNLEPTVVEPGEPLVVTMEWRWR
jgi:galactose mutarotase-like enzyme